MSAIMFRRASMLSLFHSIRIIALCSLLIPGRMTLPDFVASLLTGSCTLPLLAPYFVSCSSLYLIHTMTLDDSRPHDDPLMHVVTGARSGRYGHPTPPASRRVRDRHYCPLLFSAMRGMVSYTKRGHIPEMFKAPAVKK